MELNILLKIKDNTKLYNYLHDNSYNYKFLNRDSKYYSELLKKYKEYERTEKINNVNKVIDNVEMASNILKIVE